MEAGYIVGTYTQGEVGGSLDKDKTNTTSETLNPMQLSISALVSVSTSFQRAIRVRSKKKPDWTKLIPFSCRSAGLIADSFENVICNNAGYSFNTKTLWFFKQ